MPYYTDDLVTLHHGEALSVLSALPDGTVDAVITDPPYSSGGMTRGDRVGSSTTSKYVQTGTATRRPDFDGDNRDQRGYAYWSALWLSECLRVAKPGALICLFSDWRQLPTTTDALQAGGWVWRGIVPWDKGEGVRPRLGGFASQAEFVAWGTRGPSDPQRLPVCLPGVIRAPVRQADKHHVTGKPTSVMRSLVQCCPPGGMVLDPFAGSGTTLIAAREFGCRAVGIEQQKDYYDIAVDRLRQRPLSAMVV